MLDAKRCTLSPHAVAASAAAAARRAGGGGPDAQGAAGAKPEVLGVLLSGFARTH